MFQSYYARYLALVRLRATGWAAGAVCSIVGLRMKKKPTAVPVISPEILEMAKKSVESEKPAPNKRCAVCGAVCTPLVGPQMETDEDLCWVCRRLKISAWKDSDQQISAQE
jgi:hypothetical protein